MIGRVPIFDISPSVSGGQFPVKAIVGEKIEVSATIFGEGQDLIGANVVLVDSTGGKSPFALMHEIWPGSDRWSAAITPSAVGDWQYYIEAWHHPIATWMQTAKIKIPLELDVELVFEEGARFFEELVTSQSGAAKKLIEKLIKKLRDDTTSAQSRLSSAFDPEIEVLVTKSPLRHFVTRSLSMPVQVDRERALVGAWYEFFPRSEGADLKSRNKPKSGTFISSMARLDEVAKMGFDVLYLPPIHPIGTSHRKGPNNTLTPGPNDPGVPWAIGNKDGGHDSINPELGTLEDFDKFLAHARELGIEIALDLALQASPNHPWVKEHPEWFSSRADGSIAYAENPPKKYEDIYPLNFDNDYEGIFATIVQIVRFWMEHGVRIFRVDNPHTKPLYFWRDLLVNIRATDPDVIFLAEAFTRPSIMHSLGKIGFHQSYTYFTWRTSIR